MVLDGTVLGEVVLDGTVIDVEVVELGGVVVELEGSVVEVVVVGGVEVSDGMSSGQPWMSS